MNLDWQQCLEFALKRERKLTNAEQVKVAAGAEKNKLVIHPD